MVSQIFQLNLFNKNIADRNSYNRALNFWNLVSNEVKQSHKLYGKKDSEALKEYYKNIYNEKQYNKYISHYYAMRLIYLVKNIKDNIKILDAGCGTGTETLLCGFLGGNVLGIDISKKRLNVAQKRKSYFIEEFKKEMAVEFELKNTFEVQGKFDLIWVNEAISHIDPIEKFLKFCYNNIKIGGKILIADGNNLNPYLFLKNKKEQKRKGSIYIIKLHPITGEKISYTVERCFSILNIKKMLSRYFEIEMIFPFGYIPFFLFKNFEKIAKFLEYNILRKLPIIKLLSFSYVIIATKSK